MSASQCRACALQNCTVSFQRMHLFMLPSPGLTSCFGETASIMRSREKGNKAILHAEVTTFLSPLASFLPQAWALSSSPQSSCLEEPVDEPSSSLRTGTRCSSASPAAARQSGRRLGLLPERRTGPCRAAPARRQTGARGSLRPALPDAPWPGCGPPAPDLEATPETCCRSWHRGFGSTLLLGCGLVMAAPPACVSPLPSASAGLPVPAGSRQVGARGKEKGEGDLLSGRGTCLGEPARSRHCRTSCPGRHRASRHRKRQEVTGGRWCRMQRPQQ